MSNKKPTSLQIKYALMWYFRFQRQWICADEVCNGGWLADILVDTEKYTMDVEIKISKDDLKRGEARKRKHDKWSNSMTNKYALCVPDYLVEYAQEWIKQTNKKYGLYLYQGGTNIFTLKRAQKLHDVYDNKFMMRIAKRLSSSVTFYMGDNIKDYSKGGIE